jgi:hypothetical protein
MRHPLAGMLYTMGAGAWSVYWDYDTHAPPTWLLTFALVGDGLTTVLPALFYVIMLLRIKTKVSGSLAQK